MRINGLEIIEDFTKHEKKSLKPMTRWIALTKTSIWQSFMDVKKVFSTVDYIPPAYTVFDIGGNKWRLITIIEYKNGLVLITHALPHNEYMKDKWKE